MISIIFTENITDKIYNPNDNWNCYMRVGYAGLSTDEKPVSAIAEDKPNYLVGNGSIFFELDTEKTFYFDGDTETWLNEGGDNMALLVTGTWSDGVLTLNKTAVEIKSAMDSGSVVYAFFPTVEQEDINSCFIIVNYYFDNELIKFQTYFSFGIYEFIAESEDDYPTTMQSD